jgi:hypothetical protein
MKPNVDFKVKPSAISVLLDFHKSGHIKSCSFYDVLSVRNISYSSFHWCKFRKHLKNLNVRQFGMVKSTGLKFWHRGHQQ